MNNKTWWVVGVIAVVVIGGLVYWGMGSGGGVSSGTSTSTNQNQQANGTSLKNLLASGKSESCTFSNDTDQEKSNGIVYIAGGKMRGDFQVYPKVGTQSVIASHMILMDNTSYVWTDQSNQGFKVSVDMATGMSNTNSQNQSVNLDEQMNYNCSSWSSDQSKFALPTTVKFTDATSMTGGSTGGVKPTGGALTQQCQACMNISDATARKQCQLAMHCTVTTPGTVQTQ